MARRREISELYVNTEQVERNIKEQYETDRSKKTVLLPTGGRTYNEAALQKDISLETLKASMRDKKLLFGTVTAVTHFKDIWCAVVNVGVFRVMIPAFAFFQESSRNTAEDISSDDPLILNKRLGSEIDFIVDRVDDKNDIAMASRNDAMKQKRDLFFGGDEPQVEVGDKVLGRVVLANRASVTIEIMGAESSIRYDEVDYGYVTDCALLYPVGTLTEAKILSIAVDESAQDGWLKLEASIKQTRPEPMERHFERVNVGERMKGQVKAVRDHGIFVTVNEDAEPFDVLCNQSSYSLEPTQKVMIKITDKRKGKGFYGQISYLMND